MKHASLLVTVQIVAQTEWLPSPATFEKWVVAAFAKGSGGEIGIRIVDEQESAMLNLRYCDRSGPTNVLAFPADPQLLDIDPEAPVGDLVICAAVVEREAAEQGKSLESHWAHMTVHGTLHLAGYDHDTEQHAQIMERLERTVLAEFGISDPYA